jgi:hypothetical protein
MKYRSVVRICLFGLLLLAASSASAKVTIGAKVGYSTSWLKRIHHFQSEVQSLGVMSESPMSLYGTKNRGSMAFGGFVSIQVNSFFFIQPELIVNSKGGRGTMTDSVRTRYDGELIINYLEIPVLAKAKFKFSPRISGVFFAGPGLEFPLDAKVVSEPDAWNGMSERKVSNINSPDVTLTLGLGLELQTNRNLLSLEVRASYSQNPEKELWYPYTTSVAPGEVGLVGLSETSLRSVTVMLGYGFGL